MYLNNLIITLLVFLTISLNAEGGEYKTKHFSFKLPEEWALASSSENHVTDTLVWERSDHGPFREGYSYSFQLKNAKVKYSFPWCTFIVNLSGKVPYWGVAQMGSKEKEVVHRLSEFEANNVIYETSTLYKWILKTHYSISNSDKTLLQNLSVYIPAENGRVTFTFTAPKESFSKYESAIFGMVKSLKISDQIKYKPGFIEKIPLMNRVYSYLYITFPVNIIGITGIGLILFGLIKSRKRRTNVG